MKTFTYSSATIEALTPYAQAFEDPNDTVLRIFRDYESRTPRPSLQGQSTSASASVVAPEPPIRIEENGDVSFTKVRAASIGGVSLSRPKWNSIMAEICVRAIERHGMAWMLDRKVPRVIQGCHKTGGFHYLKDAKVSIQYTDATKACQYAIEMARALEVSLEVQFEWPDKEKAAHPGRAGLVSVNAPG